MLGLSGRGEVEKSSVASVFGQMRAHQKKLADSACGRNLRARRSGI